MGAGARNGRKGKAKKAVKKEAEVKASQASPITRMTDSFKDSGKNAKTK